MAAAANPEKRAEVRRLVEVDGMSLTKAAQQLGLGARTVRRWQQDDERAGDPWALSGQSAEQKARMDALSDEERAQVAERARQAVARRWENRRREEADSAGLAATALRMQMQNMLPHLASSMLENGSPADTDGMRPQRLATAVKAMVVGYAVMVDKADKLTGFDQAGTELSDVDGDPVAGVNEAVTLLADIRARRRSA